MATREMEKVVAGATARVSVEPVPNGPAWAAFLAAGIGAFAVGFIVLINELDLYSVPTLYGPAGGVSGRTTAAVVVWLISWAILHWRWRTRQVDAARVGVMTFVLIALGILGTFPPFWGVL